MRNRPEMKDLREIGELLKNTRKKKSLTVEKIYQKTHIYPGIIKSLEEADTENMLNKLYTKGFLKKYADFLGLDKEKLADEFERLYLDTAMIIDERFRQGIGLDKVDGDVEVDGKVSGQLFGFESEFSKGRLGAIEKKVLEEEGISLGQFKVKQMPELSSKGTRKSIVLLLRTLSLLRWRRTSFMREGLLQQFHSIWKRGITQQQCCASS